MHTLSRASPKVDPDDILLVLKLYREDRSLCSFKLVEHLLGAHLLDMRLTCCNTLKKMNDTNFLSHQTAHLQDDFNIMEP